jgi:hypothetical protein
MTSLTVLREKLIMDYVGLSNQPKILAFIGTKQEGNKPASAQLSENEGR